MRTYTRQAHVGRRSSNGGLFKYWARHYKRTAKLKGWWGFLRDQARMEQADAYSAKVEEQARIDAEDELFAERCRQQHDAERQAVTRDQRWLASLGWGATFWEAGLGPTPSWSLRRVVKLVGRDEWGDFDEWHAERVATIVLDRDGFQWVCATPDLSLHRFDLMDTCLEELQTALTAQYLLAGD